MILHCTLVAVQFAGIAFFVGTGSTYPQTILVLILQLVSLTLGLWAVVAMKLHTITVLPSVRQGGQLCTSGPYRFIRHPMYSAVLLLLLAFLLNDFSYPRLVVFLLVLIDLLIKIEVEEKLLIAHYPDYKEYMKQAKRLVPFVY